MRILFLACLVLLSACAQKKAKNYTEQSPKFSNSRSFQESPALVKKAAEKVLQDLLENSDPATDSSVKTENEKLSLGWVYENSKDKSVVYDFNGAPQRKILKVRRKIAFTVHPALAGSEVVISAEEEIENLDLKSGERKGWKPVSVDPGFYDRLMQRLREKIRAL